MRQARAALLFLRNLRDHHHHLLRGFGRARRFLRHFRSSARFLLGTRGVKDTRCFFFHPRVGSAFHHARRRCFELLHCDPARLVVSLSFSWDGFEAFSLFLSLSGMGGFFSLPEQGVGFSSDVCCGRSSGCLLGSKLEFVFAVKISAAAVTCKTGCFWHFRYDYVRPHRDLFPSVTTLPPPPPAS